MKRSKTIRTVAIGTLCFATLTTSACVTQSTYDTTTADLNSTKAELQSARAETQGLAQQVSDLQQRKIELANQMVVASMALDQAKKEMMAERRVLQKRLSNLTHTVKHLITEQKSLRDGFKRATQQRVSLQSAVDSYSSQLGSIDELSASSSPSAAVTNESARVAIASPAPIVTTTAAPASQPTIIPKPQPARNQPPEPVEEDWLTFFKNWISSLWESVAFF